MYRVLRIINRFNLGGPTFNAVLLTKHLAPEFETLLVAGMKDKSEGSSAFIAEEAEVKYQFLSKMNRSIHLYNDLKTYFQIKKIIKEYKPQIVHTHASKAGILGRLAAYHCKVPVIVHTFHGHIFHSYFSSVVSSFFIGLEKKLAKITDRIITISEQQKKELCQTYHIASPDKFSVIPLGFDLSRFTENKEMKRNSFRNRYKLLSDEIAIGIIGRIVPVKNHTLFIDAIDYIKKNTSKKIKAFIVGDGEDREKISTYIHSKGLSQTTSENYDPSGLFVFTSWIKEIDVVDAGLDIVTLCSLNEGTPVSLIEARAAGKPVVSTIVGGIEEIVSHNQTALLSSVQDQELYCKNLCKLVNEDELRCHLGKSNNDQIFSTYNYLRLIEDTKNLYYNLLADKS